MNSIYNVFSSNYDLNSSMCKCFPYQKYTYNFHIFRHRNMTLFYSYSLMFSTNLMMLSYQQNKEISRAYLSQLHIRKWHVQMPVTNCPTGANMMSSPYKDEGFIWLRTRQAGRHINLSNRYRVCKQGQQCASQDISLMTALDLNIYLMWLPGKYPQTISR